MRGATECAKRLKVLVSQLRARLGQLPTPQSSDPVSQLILGILSRDTPESKAQDGLSRLRGMVVDYNELRVIPALELSEMLADFPDARLKCEDISRALNRIFALEHAVDLDKLHELNKRDLLSYLDKIDGAEAYSRARLRLLGLRQHAIPLDEAMWAYARHHEIVAPRCDLQEAEQFLERQTDPEEGLEVFALLREQAWEEFGDAVRNQETEDEGGPVRRILSVPPDRTTKHMLQAAAGLAPVRAPDEVAPPPNLEPAEVAAATTTTDTPKRSRKRASGTRQKSTSKSQSRGSTARKSAAKTKAGSARKSSRKAGKTGGAGKKSRKKTKRSTPSKTKRTTTRKKKTTKKTKRTTRKGRSS